jgi:2-succinyl-5-enolpyruvyl-6-hydroxy-3-cyclohexene-1-carboxylate synthase
MIGAAMYRLSKRISSDFCIKIRIKMTTQVVFNVNTNWCRAIVAALVQLGVEDAIVCPGGRSAAMVCALREHSDIRMFVQTDERSAGFFALGLAKSTGRPAVVCVTSGSAVANLLPALTEAAACGTPLVILSCDRPKQLRGAGLPQTTQQFAFCAPLVSAGIDLEDPTTDPERINALKASITDLGRYLSDSATSGPVQINVPQSGRITAVDGIHGWDVPLPQAPRLLANRPPPVHHNVDIGQIVEGLRLRPGLKGLVIAGPDDLIEAEAIRDFCETIQFPLLADAPGSIRGLGISVAVSAADFLVTQPDLAREVPDIVIRLGSVPVASSVQSYLERTKAPVLHIRAKSGEATSSSEHKKLLAAPDRRTLRALAACLAVGNLEWRDKWLNSSGRVREKLPQVINSLPWCELQAVRDAIENEGGDTFIHIANSLSLRLGNMLIPIDNSHRQIYANRGVSGIDGTFGTFFGELAGHGKRGLLFVGDLAAMHDIPALEANLHSKFAGKVVVLNNNGAGLFDLLPVRNVPEYERWIKNPINFDFGMIAKAFHLPFTRCMDRQEFERALCSDAGREKLHIIEAVFPEGSAAATIPAFIMALNRA